MNDIIPSLFTLALNRSAEIKQQLDALNKMLPAVELEESEFLQKREKLLAFIKNTQLASRKWRETSQALAPLLGLDGDGLTIKQIKELSRMALLCFAEDKPEPQWFDAKYFEQVQEIVSKAKRLYQDHNLLKSRLDATYTDGIYELDLDGLIARYSGISRLYENFQFKLPQRPKTNRQSNQRRQSSKNRAK